MIVVIINIGKILFGFFKNDIIKKVEIINVVRFNLCLCGRFNVVEFILWLNNLLFNLLNVINELEKVIVLMKIFKNIFMLWMFVRVVCFVWNVVSVILFKLVGVMVFMCKF